MDFIEEVHALDVDVVVFGGDDIRVIAEFLDVDDGDFRFAVVVVQRLRCFDIASEGFAGVDKVND
ncbi:hypothetical protein HmCmsJML025_03606 [Escherichia coli]|nr:hypothetical protein HmCmsJML025_03606 [Escherichia coli]